MTKKQKSRCKKIIHAASVSAGGIGAGIAQIPGADNVAIKPIQIAMITALAGVFDKDLTEAGATAILGNLLASTIGRGISQVLVGWIPGIGNAINATTAAGLTETLGWTVAKQFDEDQSEQNEL